MGLFDWNKTDDEPEDRYGLIRTSKEDMAQYGVCDICGGPGDGSACDHRADGRPWWSTHPEEE